MMHFRTLIYAVAGPFLAVLCLMSCSSKKYLSEGQYLLDRSEVYPSSLDGYVRQHPNQRWFSSVKVPLGIWLMAGKGDGRVRRMIRRMGEAPVIYDTLQSSRSVAQIATAVRAQGYLQAQVTRTEQPKGHKMRVRYDVNFGPCYHIRDLSTEVRDEALLPMLEPLMGESLLHEGMPFDANVLDEERSRIATELNNRGYYHFNKDFITYVADTTLGRHCRHHDSASLRAAWRHGGVPPHLSLG